MCVFMFGSFLIFTSVWLSFGSRSVAHNLILAHAYAVKVYREDFEPQHKGSIGITLDCSWFMPYDESSESR